MAGPCVPATQAQSGRVHSCHHFGEEQCPVTEQLCCFLLKLKGLLEDSVVEMSRFEMSRNEDL